MDSTTRQVTQEFLPYFRVYSDGSAVSVHDDPFVPPSPSDPATGVSSKDVTISPETGISARIFLPKLTTTTTQKLPILVYFHGGGFCVGSAFSFANHRYLNSLSSQSNALAVSVEYRLAPQHHLPTAYHDCWSALQWVSSHSGDGAGDFSGEPWLTQYGDFNRVFVAGDSAGGNIAHNIAMKAGEENLPNGLKISGVIVSHGGFWSSGREESIFPRLWSFVNPGSTLGLDDPAVCPWATGAPSLAGLGCSRLLVCVAEKDVFRDLGVRYYEAVRESEWSGEAELFESEGEGHCFQISNPESQNVDPMIKRLTSFIQN